ncbi:hypothetical protein ABEB36_003848 [Hypothenemus hampei]|uniref:Uncharacterized protein n=1 Tax=Hypothenemus hampei TaxID=57062 RepID=A0ABD1F1X7_HYPHA
MLLKHPKPQARKWIKKGALALFIFEGVFFIGSYLGWQKVRTDRDSRKYLNDHFPSILEVFYKTGEFFDSNDRTRKIDQAYWNAQKVNIIV